MRSIALAALFAAGLTLPALADAPPASGDIVEQNGVLIFYPPGTAEAQRLAAETPQPAVVNKAIAVHNVVVQVRGGWGGWGPARWSPLWSAQRWNPRYPGFYNSYSGPRYPF
jgi:hypothetical protein